ncbi:MAG: xanthine dehydrogenase family protein molybdopterin-binding subunit [Deltaproteobacteria bacterium]|nr:xanthine dehydrogenase family protein molybdopterin-binding subunit [Deltaproteobacteria bacterium]
MSIGQSIRRFDALGRVTGETRFGGDLAGPEVLSAAVIRSPHAHARLKRIDVEAARRAPGVVAVYTAADVKGTNRHGLIRRDHPVFCTDRVRYLGDALGVVVAVTPKLAEEACRAVRVEAELLPVVGSLDEALAPGSYPIHAEGNVCASQLIRKGDADRALAGAEVVVEEVFNLRGVDHAFLDLEAGMAELDGETVVIHAAGQWVHEERRLIALALGVPVERVRVVQPPSGGAFGGREDISIQIYLGLATLELRRPVRLAYSREESMRARHKRHPIRIHYTLGAQRDGTITAAKVVVYSDEGAYASTGPAVLRKAVSHCTGPYRVPNISCDGVSVYTNTCPTGAMRGFGACQMAVAYEGMVYKLARTLGVDLIELKRKNLLRDGDDVTTGQRIPVAGASDCLDAALERFGWSHRNHAAPAPHLRRGFGVSTICFGLGYGDGFPDASRARVRIAEDGYAEVFSGGVDFGQGLHSLLAQIAAQELGLPPNHVRVVGGDTGCTPESGSSSATRQTVFSGNAVRLAAAEVARQLLDAAAISTGLHWDELVLREGQLVGLEDPTVCMPMSMAVHHARERGYSLEASALYKPGTLAPSAETGKSPRAFITYMFASHVAQVLVDVETGEVTVERHVAAHDVGRAINPQQVAGQIEGGVAQGLGMALMEELVVKEGRILNASFTDYIIPTIVDVPAIEAVIVERPDPEGPYGARGVGEPPLIAAVPAILGAISDAIGRQVTETPATAERVWRALQESTSSPPSLRRIG